MLAPQYNYVAHPRRVARVKKELAEITGNCLPRASMAVNAGGTAPRISAETDKTSDAVLLSSPDQIEILGKLPAVIEIVVVTLLGDANRTKPPDISSG